MGRCARLPVFGRIAAGHDVSRDVAQLGSNTGRHCHGHRRAGRCSLAEARGMNRASTFLIRHAVWLAAILILVWAILSVPELGQSGYWVLLSQSRFAIAALALALMPIMLTGGIDLSVGSTTVLSSVVIGYCWHEFGLPIEAAIAMGLCTGMLAGL